MDRTALHGWVIVDKPAGLTSMAVTAQMRRALGVSRAGHGGTLDPFATGVLPIALGEATKTVSFMLQGTKGYEFVVRWGQSTTTDDTEGAVVAFSDHRPSIAEITGALPLFMGHIQQIPPIFSALKVRGVRSYRRARAGDDFVLPPRWVHVQSFHLLEVMDASHARFQVTCSAGTYVRALGRDLAQKLGTHGHVTALRRVAAGRFSVKDAISLDYASKMRHDPLAFVYPLEVVLDDILALPLDEQEAWRLHQGQSLARPGLRDARVVLCTFQGQAVALARGEGGSVFPFCVFNHSRKERLVADVDDRGRTS